MADVWEGVKWGVFRWKVVALANSESSCLYVGPQLEFHINAGYCNLNGLIFVERRAWGQAGFEPTQLCGSKLKLHLSPFALGPTNSPSFHHRHQLVLQRFNPQTQRHSPLDVSKTRLRIISTDIKSHVLIVTVNDEAAIGVSWWSQPQRQDLQLYHPLGFNGGIDSKASLEAGQGWISSLGIDLGKSWGTDGMTGSIGRQRGSPHGYRELGGLGLVVDRI